jgi:hypothetical protein
MSDFIEKFKLRQLLGFNVNRKKNLNDYIDLKGKYYAEQYRNGQLVGRFPIENAITNVGKDYLLNSGFNSGTQVASTSWFIALIDTTSFTALNVTDTMSSHGGWLEFTGYSETTRVAWGQSNSSGQTVTNGTPVTFDITANGTLKGIFITSIGTKSGTTGTLWSTGTFNADVPVSIGDQFKITYAVAA